MLVSKILGGGGGVAPLAPPASPALHLYLNCLTIYALIFELFDNSCTYF